MAFWRRPPTNPVRIDARVSLPLDVEVSCLDAAVKWNPVVPTLAIRIFNAKKRWDGTPEKDSAGKYQIAGYKKLDHMMKTEFVCFEELAFDDVEREGGGFPKNTVPFDTVHATAILDSFDKWHDKLGAVYIHCVQGMSRSPAIAIALREIYGIKGPKWDALTRDFSLTHNRHVVITMLETASERRQHYRTPAPPQARRPPEYLPRYNTNP